MPAKKQITFDDDDDTNEEEILEQEVETEEEEDVDEKVKNDDEQGVDEETEEEIVEESSDEEVSDVEVTDEEGLLRLWRELSPPQSEDSVVQNWYGAIYEHKKKSYLYVGKAIRRFFFDVDGPVTAIELDCLKPKLGTGTVLESYGSTQECEKRDIGEFPSTTLLLDL